MYSGGIMVKIELSDFSEKDYTLIKSSNTWKVYEGKETFDKKYNKDIDSLITSKRLEQISMNQNVGLCQVNSIIYKKRGVYEKFDGYVVKKAPGQSYNDLSKSGGVSLDALVEMFCDLYIKIKANENRSGYVFSDLATSSNIFWNEKTKENIMIDVDGIQVPGFQPTTTAANIDTTASSPLEMRRLHLVQDFRRQVDIGHIYKHKFYDKKTHSFRTTINDLSLLVLFYAMATGKNFMSAEKLDCSNIMNLISTDLLKSGLDEYDVFYQNVLDTVNLNCESKDVFLDSLYQLRKKYNLEYATTRNSMVKQRKFVLK